MNTRGIPEKNRTAWTNRANGALESYADILYKGASWRHDSFASDIPQRYAYYMLQDGVSLLVTGHEHEADKLLILAEEIANEAFITENYDHGDSIRGYYPDEMATVRGKATCLETRHNAHWYRTNEKSPSELREAADWYSKYLIDWVKNDMPEEEGMWRYIIAEDYDNAISWYHHHYRKALSNPVNDKRYITSTIHVLYFLTEYARGNEDIMPIARAGTQHWYDLFVDTRYSSPDHLDANKRAWYYFWHHYFCDQHDIRKILVNSRGY